MADKQQKRVYRWESAWGTWSGACSSKNCRYWHRWACEAYGIDVPKLELARDNRGESFFRGDTNLVRLVKCHQNYSVVFHEAAHAVAFYYYPGSVEDHGPEWLGIFLWMLRESKAVPEIALQASAKEHKLKWKSLDKSSPESLKAAAKRKGPKRGLEVLASGTDLI